MVKALSIGLCVLSVCSCIFMQPQELISVAEITVAEGTPATVVTETAVISRPKTMTVVATAYCSCRVCCGIYADNRPNGVVYTASGVVAKANHTIAVDTSVIPFGTRVRFPNGNIFVAEDTGGAIKGNRIDIYFDSHSEALSWGIRTIEIEVLK